MSDTQGVTLLKVVIETLKKTVTSEHRPEGNEGIPPVKMSVKDDLHRRNIQSKVPEDGWSLACSKRSKHAYVCGDTQCLLSFSLFTYQI